MSEVLLLIPARFASERFPGKPLVNILGKPMIDYVVENARASGFDYAVVTDDEKIASHLKSRGASFVMVEDNVPSGSERIALAYERFYKEKGYKLVINIQGDEPLLKASEIKRIASFHLEHQGFDIATMVKKRDHEDIEINNPNIVKCVYSLESKKAHYFSRSAVPHSRSGEKITWFQHIGVYSYKPNSLVSFSKLPPSNLEKIEKLEQLRALDNNMSIGVVETDVILLGVDVPSDIEKVEGVLNVHKK